MRLGGQVVRKFGQGAERRGRRERADQESKGPGGAAFKVAGAKEAPT